MTRISGGCACGAVRYELAGGIDFAFHCHCRQCQHATGGGHSSLMVVKNNQVQIQGVLRYYEQQADDGNQVRRGFCAHCGSPVSGMSSGSPDVMLFYAATMDNSENFKPQRVVWNSEKPEWDYIDPDLPVVETQ